MAAHVSEQGRGWMSKSSTRHGIAFIVSYRRPGRDAQQNVTGRIARLMAQPFCSRFTSVKLKKAR
jgi:hypothetical protein